MQITTNPKDLTGSYEWKLQLLFMKYDTSMKQAISRSDSELADITLDVAIAKLDLEFLENYGYVHKPT